MEPHDIEWLLDPTTDMHSHQPLGFKHKMFDSPFTFLMDVFAAQIYKFQWCHSKFYCSFATTYFLQVFHV